MHRFENQKETTRHLEELKKDNEKLIIRLKEDKEKMNQEFEEMKYSGDSKLSGYVISLCLKDNSVDVALIIMSALPFGWYFLLNCLVM